MFRDDSKPLFDSTNFRKEWIKACVKVGLGKMSGKKCYQYELLIPQNLRRSPVRNMVTAGNDQATAMSISGHKTIHVFQRYNIIDVKDRLAAMKRLQCKFDASCRSRKRGMSGKLLILQAWGPYGTQEHRNDSAQFPSCAQAHSCSSRAAFSSHTN